jgi:hypothetical protein
VVTGAAGGDDLKVAIPVSTIGSTLASLSAALDRERPALECSERLLAGKRVDSTRIGPSTRIELIIVASGSVEVEAKTGTTTIF